MLKSSLLAGLSSQSPRFLWMATRSELSLEDELGMRIFPNLHLHPTSCPPHPFCSPEAVSQRKRSRRNKNIPGSWSPIEGHSQPWPVSTPSWFLLSLEESLCWVPFSQATLYSGTVRSTDTEKTVLCFILRGVYRSLYSWMSKATQGRTGLFWLTVAGEVHHNWEAMATGLWGG